MYKALRNFLTLILLCPIMIFHWPNLNQHGGNMKKNQLEKKLTLQKETVATIENNSLDKVKGGCSVLLPAPSRNPGNSCTCM
jgi:hypothetical protein